MSGKPINWDRPVEWSTGEDAKTIPWMSGDDYFEVTACREWLKLTDCGNVSVDNQTGQILGCEEEGLPYVRNVRDLCINTLGEVHLGDDYIGGDINVSDNRSEEELERRFKQQLVDGGLSAEQVALVEKVWEAQKSNDSRIRLAYFGGRPVVESEFVAFSDNTAMWTRIAAAAARIDAHVDEMCEFPYLDHYCPGPNSAPRPDARPSTERAGWFIGPDHGRMERQVALQLFLTDDFTPEQLAEARQKLSDATDDIWSDAGMALL